MLPPLSLRLSATYRAILVRQSAVVNSFLRISAESNSMYPYSIFESLMNSHGLTISQVAKQTGIAPSTITDWRAGRYTPKSDKIDKIATLFGVSLEYMATGKEAAKQSDSGKTYYFSDETAAAAQRLFERKDLRALMDSASTLSADKVEALANMALMLKGTNPDG